MYVMNSIAGGAADLDHRACREETAGSFDRSRLEGTNINPATLLATDYFNHFNDVEMVLEMMPADPDAFSDIVDWQPRSYVEHFAQSGLRDAQTAIDAYAHVDPDLKAAFESLIADLDAVTLTALQFARMSFIIELQAEGLDGCAKATKKMRDLLRRASALVNGTGSQPAGRQARAKAQDTVNALFDD